MIALALSPGVAAGQPDEPAPEATAAAVEAHLRRGVELRRGGHDDEALPEFEAAHRMAPGPRTAAQLGLARQAIGSWLDADRLLREALASPDDPWVSRNRAALEAMVALTSTHVGTLDVRANVSGARVVIEGGVVATLPLTAPLRVLSGTVSLEVTASGYATVSRRFVLEPGATVRESVALQPLPAPTPTAVAQPRVDATAAPRRDEAATEAPWWRRWAWAPTAVGSASLLLAGVALAAREDAAVRYNSARCPPPPPPNPSACGDLNDAASTWEATAWVAGALGVTLLAAGVVMLVAPPRARARASLGCAPIGAGATCGLRF